MLHVSIIKFVFFEKEIESGNVKLVVGEKQQNQKIKIVKKIKWDKFIGEIKFSNENTIDIEAQNNHDSLILKQRISLGMNNK